MKTIEERASEYAHTEWISEFTDIAKESYTKGATEQKAIDIDKVCDWLRARNVLTEESLEGFRKAMEE